MRNMTFIEYKYMGIVYLHEKTKDGFYLNSKNKCFMLCIIIFSDKKGVPTPGIEPGPPA